MSAIIQNPTNEIDVSFKNYVTERTLKEAEHLKGGIPDYAYAADFSLRQKIRKVPGVYAFFKAYTNTWLAQYRQEINMSGMRVTNKQFPRLYEIIHHCAETLGIGIPTLYVYNSGNYEINAAAFACEASDPLIYVTPAAVERLTDEEMIAVLGHECGHIQNDHLIYQQIVEQLLSAGVGLAKAVQELITLPLQAALYSWSRVAEVTADRAGCICVGKLQPSLSLQAKLMSGGEINETEYDIDEIITLFDEMKSMERSMELFGANHPVSVRRMLAQQEFFKSEVYYDWHPEQRQKGVTYYAKAELDSRCDKYLSTLKKGDR